MIGGLFDEEEKRLCLYPITMLGNAKSGKTSLVYSFVQNFCPTVYVPSLDPALFYKTIDLVDVRSKTGYRFKEDTAGEEDVSAKKACMVCQEKFSDTETIWRSTAEPSEGAVCRQCWMKLREDQAFPVLVEIEDTYGWHSQEEDRYGNDHNAENFINLHADHDGSTPAKLNSSRHNKEETAASIEAKEKSSGPSAGMLLGGLKGLGMQALVGGPDYDFMLLSKFNPPTHLEHVPMTVGRLGFMIVFDTHDAESFNVAKEIHESLERQRKGNLLGSGCKEPVVFFVASQLDRDLRSHDAIQIRTEAQKYVKQACKGGKLQQFFYEEVSAPELRKVKALFRKMLARIKEQTDESAQEKQEAADAKSGWFGAGGGVGGGMFTRQISEEDSQKNDAETPKKDCVLQ